ncbi:MAG: ATP-binding protein [Gallionella sp.]|nr:ATP-binding protein [Gallionella sp.]
MLIRTRLILIGLLPLLLLLFFVAGGMVTQNQLDSLREKVVLADNLGKNLFNLVIVEHDLLKNKSDRPRQQWQFLIQELESQLPKARKTFSSTDESELMETLLEYFENSQRDFQELVQWLDQHQDQTLSTVQQVYLARLSERLHINLQSAIPIANQIASINQEKAVAFDQKREKLTVFILIFLTGLIPLILWPLIRGITRSVNHLKTSMTQVALGNLEFHIEMTGQDEFAQLARHFNEMISKLAEVTVARKVLSAEIVGRKQAEEKILTLNQELENKVAERTKQLMTAQESLVRREKLAVLGQVAGSVGHELRNPLSVMSNAVYFLQTVLTDADDTTREYLNIIKNEITNSERIVSDLLDSVRTKPPQPEAVGLREIIQMTLGKLTIPDAVSVKLDIPETLSDLRVDPLQIHQVLRNLISNGIEAMPEGGTLQISAIENKPGGTVTLSVQDTGVGMTAEQLGHLFQPLFTTKARGIGLGLVVVKNLTEANGGKIAVQSETGRGTQFIVTLPAAR